ncbi:hypothetical protein O6H91_23G019300 [Diphasiastrum complanatum]|uniref:Uncharacterized protein n=1 Tax=Diphasiastrum complanatum TaxID=34168 RepID=A0ACC2A8R0_DIPCM|nr:hypothetical protein O6H91_23G019300 [Diphasiastrum complanatum]
MEVEEREPLIAPAQWAAPAIFGTILVLHLLTRALELLIPKERMQPEEINLVKEINRLQKEADALSTSISFGDRPSTFAKAAKLRRVVAAKEKELHDCREKLSAKVHSSWLSKTIILRLLKASLYVFLLWWFWKIPVSLIPASLLQPFEWVFSISKVGQTSEAFIEIWIIPWLVLSTNVSVFLSKCLLKEKSISRKSRSFLRLF